MRRATPWLLLLLLTLSSSAWAAEPPAAGAEAAPGERDGDPGAEPGLGEWEEGLEGLDGLPDPLDDFKVVPMLDDRIRTAVPEVQNVGTEADAGGLGRLISEQLRRDLTMSGFFDLLPADSYSLVEDMGVGLNATAIDYEGWQLVNADYLVKGVFEVKGKRVALDLRLFDVHGNKIVGLEWAPRDVTAGNYQKAVHDFVNAMIKFRTGRKGPFGSAILFSGASSGNNRRIHSALLGNTGITTYGVPRGINVLPTWGRAGQVLYSTFGPDGGELRSYDIKARQSTLISAFAGVNLSADYCASKDLYALTLSRDGDAEIYTMKSDGTELTRLTVHEANDASPSWSPGCRNIAFVSNRDGSPQIYVMRADGSSVRRLTHVGNYNTTPEWSPVYDEDGRKVSWIAFTARDERNHFDIFIVSPDGTEVYRITQDQGNNESPSWSPGGRYLVFESTRDGRLPRLYMTRADTRGNFQVRVADGFGYRTPSWQR